MRGEIISSWEVVNKRFQVEKTFFDRQAVLSRGRSGTEKNVRTWRLLCGGVEKQKSKRSCFSTFTSSIGG